MQSSPFAPPLLERGQLASFGELTRQLLYDQFCSQLQFKVQPEPAMTISLAFRQPMLLTGLGPKPFHRTALEAT
jgi:hypothetical protein